MNNHIHKCVIFDLDGVIANTEPVVLQAYRTYLPEMTLDEHKSLYYSNVYEKTSEMVASGLFTRDEFQNTYHKLYEDVTIFPKMVPIIKSLSERYHLAINSSTNDHMIEHFLLKNDILDLFGSVLGSTKEHKKSVKIKYILEMFGVTPDNAVFITDTSGDIEEGRAAGVDSIAVTWGYHDVAHLETAKPIALASSVEELEMAIERKLGA